MVLGGFRSFHVLVTTNISALCRPNDLPAVSAVPVYGGWNPLSVDSNSYSYL